jgi:hypothetical protein
MDNIYIPSYKRHERVRAYEYLGVGKIVVPESQKRQYEERYGDAVIAVDDKRDGSVSKKRNAILDLIKEEQGDGYGWIIDDDFNCLKRKKENIELTGDETLEHFERLYIMAKDMNAKYGGFDYSGDCMKLKDMSPFSMTKPIFAVTLINVFDGLKYDERFRLNEDVEFFIQKMNNNRFIIKDNQYVALCHGEDGGSESAIGYSRADQRKYATMINNKWGYKAIVWKKTKFEFKHPIKGA